MPEARVLHVAEAFGGGLLGMVKQISEYAAANGHAQAIAYGRRPETPEDVRAAIDPSVELFALEGWGRRRPQTELAAGRALRRLVAEWGADVVHVHSSFAGVAARWALGRRVPVIYTPHSFASELPGTSLLHRRAFRILERYVMRGADVVGAVSASEGRSARARRARLVVEIPNGIPELDGIGRRPGPTAMGRPPRVIATGRLVGQRRPESAARVLSAVKDIADVEWVGGGGAEGEVTEAGRRALEEAGVPVTGWVPRERVLAELARARIYLHWTSWDGLPLTVLEAFATDTLVVASDIPPNRDLLDARQVAATEEEAVAVLRRVLSEPGLAQELLLLQARRRVAYGAQLNAARWMHFYDELASRR